MAPGEFRLRLCYSKRDRLRFLSHLEVMRALERGARRARLPYAVTRGFNPHMKMAFGPALPVGTAGLREYVDVWLVEYVPAEEARLRLAGSLPPSLAPLEARYVAGDLSSLSAACTIAVYEIVFEGEDVGHEQLAEALAAVIREGVLSVEHKGKNKVFDLTRTLPKEVAVRSDGDEAIVDLTVRTGPEGSLRPEMLITEALSRIAAAGAAMKVTRTDSLIEGDGGFTRPL